MSIVLIQGWSDVNRVVKEGCQMSLVLFQGWSDVTSVVKGVVRCH